MRILDLCEDVCELYTVKPVSHPGCVPSVPGIGFGSLTQFTVSDLVIDMRETDVFSKHKIVNHLLIYSGFVSERLRG